MEISKQEGYTLPIWLRALEHVTSLLVVTVQSYEQKDKITFILFLQYIDPNVEDENFYTERNTSLVRLFWIHFSYDSKQV
jgi:spermidine/putrescine-binding protein